MSTEPKDPNQIEHNDPTEATDVTEEIPVIKMSEEEKAFIITQAYETVFREITLKWTETRDIYQVQEYLTGLTETEGDAPDRWAQLCADDYYKYYRRVFDSLTIRKEWTDFFIKAFLRISKTIALTFENPFDLKLEDP